MTQMTRKLISAFLLACSAPLGAENYLSAIGTNGYALTPSAFMKPEGQTSLSYHWSEQRKIGSIEFQALDNLSIGVISSSHETHGREKQLNMRFQLYEERGLLPSIAIGVNDVLGRGPSSAEYLVASKHFGTLEASLGFGWGALSDWDQAAGSDGREAADKYELTAAHMFQGKPTGFASLAWSTLGSRLALGVEYHDQGVGNAFRTSALYRVSHHTAIGLYFIGDGTMGVSLHLSGNPSKPYSSPPSSPPPIAVPRAKTGSSRDGRWVNQVGISRKMAEWLDELVSTEGYKMRASRISANRLEVELMDSKTLETPKIIGRVARSLAMNAPGSIDEFVITIVNGREIPVSSVIINRANLEKDLERYGRSETSWQHVKLVGATALEGEGVVSVEEKRRFSIDPSINPSVVDEGGELVTKIDPGISANWRLGRGLKISGLVSLNTSIPETSLTPEDAKTRIRTDSALYRQDRLSLVNLKGAYDYKLAPQIYGRTSAGLLERQYAGLSSELIYAEPASPFAYGLDLSYARKRDPQSAFGLLDASSVTGFGTLYWETGFKGLEASIAYGRFLGGDWGTDIGLERKFRGGWSVRGNLSASEDFFASGSTKDLSSSLGFKIPWAWASPVPTKRTSGFSLGAGSGDSASRLGGSHGLYNSIRNYDAGDYELRWGSFWQ